MYAKIKEVVVLDYLIKNKKGVFIKLNDKGSPITCREHNKGVFEYSKARNLVDSLPKSLRRMGFYVEAIPEIPPKTIENTKTEVSEQVARWVDKFGICADTLNEAKSRADELIQALYDIDQELIDVLHVIEIEKPKDMYSGYLEYKHIKNIREKRRDIKDELLIIENVLKEINPSCLQRERVQKAIDGLLGRKYKFRIVEEDNTNAV